MPKYDLPYSKKLLLNTGKEKMDLNNGLLITCFVCITVNVALDSVSVYSFTNLNYPF